MPTTENLPLDLADVLKGLEFDDDTGVLIESIQFFDEDAVLLFSIKFYDETPNQLWQVKVIGTKQENLARN